MIVSVNDGFLYISKDSLLSFLVIVTSKTLILIFTSSSKVKFRLGTVLLNASRTLFMYVQHRYSDKTFLFSIHKNT